MTTALTTRDELMPALTIGDAVGRFNAVVDFVKTVMKPNTDYGVIPGTSKPTLLKPGAEKLTTLFGLSPRFEEIKSVEDWTGKDHDGEPLFYYRVKCQLTRGDRVVGEGEGSCNSWEKKYRWRNGERVCPECGKPTIIKGRAEYGGGYICFAKKGGCGAKFKDNDPAIANQQTGQVKNPEVHDIVNTILKMAEKRALIAATLIAVNASEFFTQDMEDAIIEGDYSEAEQKPTTQQVDKPEPRKPRPPAFQEPPANMHPSITPSLRGRWDTIVAEARALNIEMNYIIDETDTADTLKERAKYIKAEIVKAADATKGN